MGDSINIQLSHNEALVLLDFFGRFERGGEFRPHHNAELVAFASVSAQLDKALVEPFQAAYTQQVEAARQRLAGGLKELRRVWCLGSQSSCFGQADALARRTALPYSP
jgi:hypothetical protein